MVAVSVPRNILVVCENDFHAGSLCMELGAMGHQAQRVTSCEDALGLVCHRHVDVVFYDTDMPGGAAANLVQGRRAVQERGEVCYIVALVPRGDENAAIAALEAGADDLLAKPVSAVELSARLAVGLRLATISERLRAGTAEVKATMARLQQAQKASEDDLAEARKLQQGLVGERNARFGPFDVSLLLRPSGHVGGDLVGFFPINSRRVALYAIDVSGHGIAAALLTARLAAHLSGSVGHNLALLTNEFDLYDARPPSGVARMFNQMMCDELRTDAYFTMVYVDLDFLSGDATLVQAGHPHPLLQRADGRIEAIGAGGHPIGLLPDATFTEVTLRLEPGDRLLISSDGITEAADPEGKLLDQEGLEAILRTNAFLHGSPLLESLCWSVAQFTRGERLDDISAVLIERDPG